MKVMKANNIGRIAGVAFVLIGLLSMSTFAVPLSHQDPAESLPAGDAGEGKADLIIEWLGMGGNWPFTQSAWAQVRNIGEADVTGYLSVWFLVRKWGIFPVYSDTVTESIASWQLTPGGTHATIHLVGGGALPSFGIYRFDAEVNPDRKFEESDYSNNWRTTWLWVFNGRWGWY